MKKSLATENQNRNQQNAGRSPPRQPDPAARNPVARVHRSNKKEVTLDDRESTWYVLMHIVVLESESFKECMIPRSTHRDIQRDHKFFLLVRQLVHATWSYRFIWLLDGSAQNLYNNSRIGAKPFLHVRPVKRSATNDGENILDRH